MIQISSPTQGPSPPDNSAYTEGKNIAENLAGDSPVFEGAQKKNKPGGFARLLEGLQVKLTKAAGGSSFRAESKSSEDVEDNALEENTVLDLLNFTEATDTKKLQSLLLEASLLEEEDLRDGLITLSNSNRELQGETLQIFTDDFVYEAEEVPLVGENSPLEINPREVKAKNDFKNLAALSEREGQNFTREAPENHVVEDGREQPVLSGDRPKNSRSVNFLHASSNAAETESSETQSWLAKAGLNLAPQGAENENLKPSDSRGKKGKERAHIEVRDLRTGEARTGVPPESSLALKDGGALNSRLPVNAEIEIPVDLSLYEKGGEGGEKAGSKSPQSVTFEDALARELRGGLSTDIVRDAAVIIRNGGEGTIRLSLRPASLGDVKIRLEMTENKITGHIILESNEALRAFERELPVLEKAFRDSGFSETNLEMFLSQDGGNFGGQRQGNEGDFMTQVLAASRYEAGSGGVDESETPDSFAPAKGGMFFPPGRNPVNLLV